MNSSEDHIETAVTAAKNAAAVVDFDDATDFEFATRGLLAQHSSNVIGPPGQPIWDGTSFDYLRADHASQSPQSVHPGLWRQGRLCAVHGLFEVTSGVWQARGYDISNITFIDTSDGWLVIDPLTTTETAAACLDLANQTLGYRPVAAVIYTHSHIDHFGGVLGVVDPADVASGKVPVIAPEGFLEEAVSEAGTAGPIMVRRGVQQFGVLLPQGPLGRVGTGLGAGLPLGSSSLIAPTVTISKTGDELVIGGIKIVFQNTPDAEAPAEMNFFFPDKRLLCMAENCTHTMHNLYPIRGAKIRDALAWSKYCQEALTMWGDDTDILFASHHWPRFGQDNVIGFLSLQRDLYRWMHDQTLRLANRGYTPGDIAETMTLPEAYSKQSHVQGYYGSVSHNVRSVYARYLGWYDGNPANLNPHPPRAAARRYVEAMGGAKSVIGNAQQAYDSGDYRWVSQLLNHLIFDDPSNQGARDLSAAAMEQMAYQAESATWRNAYLTAAHELRHGSYFFGQTKPPAVCDAMTATQLVDLLGVRFDPSKFQRDTTMVWKINGATEDHLIGVCNDAIHHVVDPGPSQRSKVEARIEATHSSIVTLAFDNTALEALCETGDFCVVEGDKSLVTQFIRALDITFTQRIVEPQVENLT